MVVAPTGKPGRARVEWNARASETVTSRLTVRSEAKEGSKERL